MKYVKAIHYVEHDRKQILEGKQNKLLEMMLNDNNIEFGLREKGQGYTSMRFHIDELDKIDTHDEEKKDIIQSIREGEYIACTYCNSVVFNYVPYIYRDGSAGRSYECFDCQCLDDEIVDKVGSIRREKGQQSAIEYIDEAYSASKEKRDARKVSKIYI